MSNTEPSRLTVASIRERAQDLRDGDPAKPEPPETHGIIVGDSVQWTEGDSHAHGIVQDVDGDYLSITCVRLKRPQDYRGVDSESDRLLHVRNVRILTQVGYCR